MVEKQSLTLKVKAVPFCTAVWEARHFSDVRFHWIIDNIWTINICEVLIGIVVGIIVGIIRKKKQGKSVVCNCGSCNGCPITNSCHKKEDN